MIALADTHTILWYLLKDARLSATAQNFLNQAIQNGDTIGISSITLIEMVYLIERGRISAQAFSLLTNKLSDNHSLLREIPIDVTIARALSKINVAQIPDMPDKIIATSALVHNVPLISRDRKIRASSIQTIW